jgi:DNA primase catalytic subunit
MLPIHVTLSHYKKLQVQEEIVYNSIDREVASRFNDRFGKRPDTIRNPGDVLELAKQGATSFHASEELWSNPLSLDPSLKRHELDSLRKGWDLVIDIDCHIFEYSKIGADLIISALKFHGINSVSVKFSGNKGFHIGVPFEAFPEVVYGQEIQKLFPEAPRKIAIYLRNLVLKEFSDRIMAYENYDFSKIIEKTGKTANELKIVRDKKIVLNAEPILEMDTLLISSRHLFRMPFSLHEKSGLVSIPFNPSKVLQFEKKLADPSNLKISKYKFLNRETAVKDEAKQLFIQAFDYAKENEILVESAKNEKGERQFDVPQNAIPEELFPPCVKLMLNGIGDGRKRALFVLVNFLTSVGWDYEMIEKRLKEWNGKNTEPLRDTILLGQIRYHKQMKKMIPPPNCSNEMYMISLGVCKPDSLCPRIKNPAQYSARKAWIMNNANSKPKGKKAAENTQNSKNNAKTPPSGTQSDRKTI